MTRSLVAPESTTTVTDAAAGVGTTKPSRRLLPPVTPMSRSSRHSRDMFLLTDVRSTIVIAEETSKGLLRPVGLSANVTVLQPPISYNGIRRTDQ
jgi:hypothetical protein